MAQPRLIRASNWHLVTECTNSSFEPLRSLGLELCSSSQVSLAERARREQNRADWWTARDSWDSAEHLRRTEAAEAARLRRKEEATTLMASPCRINAGNWDLVAAFAPPGYEPPHFLPLGKECLGSAEELARHQANYDDWRQHPQCWENAEHKIQQQCTAEELWQQQAAAALHLAEKAMQERVVINKRL